MSSRRYVICDIEATGLSDDKDIIEIALITIESNKIVDVYQTLVNPLVPISEFIQDFTSISAREIEQAPKFYDIADALRVRLEDNVFVSHNTDFDYTLLQKKFAELGQEIRLKTFCTLKVAQEEIPGLSNYNLDALCSFFRIKNHERHRALGDARATLELFYELSSLRLKLKPEVLFHDRHEKEFKKLSARAGLLHFKNKDNKVIRSEVAFNLEKKARELLQIRPENKFLLENTYCLQPEETGSALIAEFRKLLFHPSPMNWVITVESAARGEKSFSLRPITKGLRGHWYFRDQSSGRKKLKALNHLIKDKTFAYREGGRSKEEILRSNQKVDQLVKDEQFPSANIVLIGEGRTLGEKSLVLIRDNHVAGYGYSSASDEDIFSAPETYLSRKFSQNIGADLVAIRYFRVLKNMRTKSDSWRAVPERSVGAA